jgi:hypothetical protein
LKEYTPYRSEKSRMKFCSGDDDCTIALALSDKEHSGVYYFEDFQANSRGDDLPRPIGHHLLRIPISTALNNVISL